MGGGKRGGGEGRFNQKLSTETIRWPKAEISSLQCHEKWGTCRGRWSSAERSAGRSCGTASEPWVRARLWGGGNGDIQSLPSTEILVVSSRGPAAAPTPQVPPSALSLHFLPLAFPPVEMFCTRCPPGWQQFAKTCYYFSTEGKSWIEARAACSMLGAQLAIVNNSPCLTLAALVSPPQL
uniref:C-type lectin domain-containing protein n=1 Tax=Pavo cristatus TaxID=9049 RepID=A0A8C9FVK6_PAVCR